MLTERIKHVGQLVHRRGTIFATRGVSGAVHSGLLNAVRCGTDGGFAQTGPANSHRSGEAAIFELPFKSKSRSGKFLSPMNRM